MDNKAVLSQETLKAIADRAAGYDSAGTFCAEDIQTLQQCGYFAAAVPAELGGGGFNLLQLSKSQRQLAGAAAATALAVNMHQVWLAVAALLHKTDTPLPEWIFQDTLAGEIFAFGISEPGNDKVLFDSLTVASPVIDGYTLNGTKIFTTLAPVFSRLGVHAKTPDGEVIFGFVRRTGTAPRTPEQASRGLASGAITHPHPWNTLGMRATHSYTTVLKDVPLAQADIIAGFAPLDFTNPVAGAIFTCFSLLTASVYLGVAERALCLAQQRVADRAGEAPENADPYQVQRLVGAKQQLVAATNSVELLCREADSMSLRPDHFLALGMAKKQASECARQLVECAIELHGSAAYSAGHELARIYRDVLASLFHPTTPTALARSMRGALGF